ncbi:MAG: virulence-associated protein E [Caudoviricetes sp.]|nr:MAG: virulence-associated protein E [Caudoviricetes sp.]
MSKLKEYKTCVYDNMKSKEHKLSDLDNYVGMVMHGANQDAVIAGRKAKAKGDIETYKRIKSESKVMTPTGIYNQGESKSEKNLQPNGIVCIDIDTDLSEDQIHALYNDQYTFIIHKSFGGDGYCVFIKIDASKLPDAYDAVSKYYLDTYDISTDKACKNPNRIRYVSYDPDILVVDNSKKFNVKVEKKDQAPKAIQYIYTKSDLDSIFEQIKERHIDLCDQDYYKYIRIALAFANEFGESGREYFHFVCSYGSKYNRDHADRDYTGCLNRGDGSCSIGTFYYYCKQVGINIYSDRTRTIINRVNISKMQGGATVDSVSSNLAIVTGTEATEEERSLINRLINDKTDYTKLANDDLTEIEQLGKFVVDMYNPTKDEITQTKYINKTVLTDELLNDINIECQIAMPFKFSSENLRIIMNSTKYVKKTNILHEFFRNNEHVTGEGYIDQYASFIYPQKEYNKWAFKKWIVGMMHNWLCDYYDKEVSPLTLVLTGQRHGTGKSSFFRNLLPSGLEQYSVESKLSTSNKDTLFRMCRNLLITDPEFGGKGFKDDEEYKDLSDKKHQTDRLAYGKEDTNMRRRCGLGGCTNKIDIIKDVTGNRRLLPLLVERIDYDAMVSMDKVGLIMEAYRLYKSGFEWKIYSDEDVAYLIENTSQNYAVMPFEEIFFKYFSTEYNYEHNTEVVMNQGEILQYLNQHSGLKPTKYDVKEIFTKNKFEYKTHSLNGRVKKGTKLFMAGNDAVPF